MYQKKFKRSMLSVALLSALQALAAAHAAEGTATEEKVDADKKDAETVEVYGIRQSIISSIDSKRDSDTIADFVESGELGSLPDMSIADALGRIPGVTTVRESGQSSQLNIRGMNGDFIQSTINGREQATTSAYTESTRWMSFDQFPSELITSAGVYKSPKASLIEGGVAGTVDLKTINPLDAAKDHNFSASFRTSKNDTTDSIGGDATGERFSLAYQGKFLDNTLGVALGIAHLKQPNSFEGAIAGADGNNGYRSRDVNGDGQAEKFPDSIQMTAGIGDDIRDGMIAAFVFKPNDNLKIAFDYFKSEFESEDFRHGVTVSGFGRPAAHYSVTNPQVNNGVLTGATMTIVNREEGPWIETRSEDQSTDADSDAYGLNVEWHISDKSTLSFDVSSSEATKTRKDRIASLHAFELGNATGVENGNSVTGPYWRELGGQALSYALNGDETPALAFNFDLTDLSYMRLSRYEEYPHEYTDEIDTIKVDFSQDVEWGPISSFEVGIRSSERLFDSNRGMFGYGSREGQFRFVDGNGNWVNSVNGVSGCSDNFTQNQMTCMPQEVDGFVSVGSVAGAPDHLIVNLDGLADSIFGAGNYAGIKAFGSRDWTFIESGAVEEKTFAYYLMTNLEGNIGRTPFSGNIGVRVIETEVTAIGLQNVGAGNGDVITDGLGNQNDYLKHIEYGPTYTDVLPSLNLNFEISADDIVRFAAAEVMGRPPAGQLKGGAGSWNGGTAGPNVYNVWTKGSPFLDPFRARQFDLSYEHYFEDGGAVTAAIFWKDIDTMVAKRFHPEGPGSAALFAELGIEIPAGMTAGAYETFVNTEDGGYIRGYELAATKTFNTLPGVFSGLGITASYSYTESEIEIPGSGQYDGIKMGVPGLSKNVWSTTIFWNIDNFSAHMNARYRDEYPTIITRPGGSETAAAKEYTVIDAQVSYAFENGLQLVLQGNNLNDEPNKIAYGDGALLGEYRTFGKQYYLGVNYKY